MICATPITYIVMKKKKDEVGDELRRNVLERKRRFQHFSPWACFHRLHFGWMDGFILSKELSFI